MTDDSSPRRGARLALGALEAGQVHVRPTNSLYPDNICNGLWEYRPDFGGEVWKKGAMKVENVASGPEGLAAENGKTGTVVWKIASPYAFVGGHLETEASGARFAVSSDGKQWTDIAGSNFDKFFPLGGNPYYQYQLRCELPAGAKLKRLAVINDLQMALLALPEMTVGENSFTYTDNRPASGTERADHTRVGGAIHQQAAGGPGGGLSARWRPGRGHGLRFPLEPGEGPRRRTRSPTITSCSPTGRIWGGRCRRISTN